MFVHKRTIVDSNNFCFKGATLLSASLQTFLKELKEVHCVKSVRVRSFSGRFFPAFGLNTERNVFKPSARKYRPEKLQIGTLFTQWYRLNSVDFHFLCFK